MKRSRKGGGIRIGRILFALLVFFVLGFTVSFFVRLRELAARDEPKDHRRQIRVQVLNGSGELGLAQELAFYLREEGFDVVEYRNAERQFDTTLLVDRVDGRLGKAREVARCLGAGVVMDQLDRSLFLEVTVVIGKDFPSYLPRIRERTKALRAP
jgi:hypothetical protein